MKRLVWILCCCWLTGSGQTLPNYLFQHLTTSNGLNRNEVVGILQDRKGFIWLASDAGLQRWDGHDFLNFPIHFDGVVYNRGIRGLYEDETGEIWGFSEKTVVCAFNPSTRAFRRIAYEGTSLKGYFFFEAANRLYIVSEKGIVRLDAARQQVESVIASIYTSADYVSATLDRQGRLWSYGKQGYYCFDPFTNRIFHRHHNPYGWDLLLLHTATLRDIYCDHQGKLWISTWDDWKIIRYDIEKNTLQVKDREALDLTVSKFIEDKQGQLWAFSSEQPPCRYFPERDTFLPITNSGNQRVDFLGNAGYTRVIRDREGFLWIVTDLGVNIFNPPLQMIHQISFSGFLQNPLSQAREIFQAQNKSVFLISDFASVKILDEKLSVQKALRTDDSHRNSDRNLPILSIDQDTFGRIWIGHDSSLITLLDTSGRKIKAMHCNECQKAGIYGIAKLRNGDFMLSLGTNGIVRWRWKTGKFEFYPIPQMKNFSTPRDNLIRSLYEDSRGYIWVGTYSKGLYRIDPDQKNVERTFYFDAPPDLWHLHNKINDILEISPDSFLISTEIGLKCLDLKRNRYVALETSNHPINMAVGNIRRDGQGNFWMVTFIGLVRLSKDWKHVRIFGEQEGISNFKLSLTAFTVLQDGRMMAGDYFGNYIVFHPDSVLIERPLFPPVLSEVRSVNQLFSVDSLLSKRLPLILPYHQNTLDISFISLTYSNPGITYRYQLKGLESSWIEAGSKRQVSYAYLPPGKYEFRVQAFAGKQQVSQITALTIIISPPWWQSWWFYLLLVLITGTVLFAIIRDRLNRFRERTTYQKRLWELENQALRAQINPHFIFNALQAVKLFVLQNDVAQAEHYMSRFARLMRQIMDNSQQNAVSLHEELELLDNYLQLEQLRHDYCFDYRFEIADDVLPNETEVPSMMLQPFVENSVLHGLVHKKDGWGLLIVRCLRRVGGLIIEIEDNGVGRTRAAALKNQLRREHHRSAGLEITARRLALFSEQMPEAARYEIIDLPDDAGTRVEIWLPTEE